MAMINKSLRLNENTAAAVEVIPNRETMEAIAEISEMKAHPEKYRSYSTFQELLDDVMEDSNLSCPKFSNTTIL